MGEPDEVVGVGKATVFGWYEHTSNDYGTDPTTPDSFCEDSLDRHGPWLRDGVVAVFLDGRWVDCAGPGLGAQQADLIVRALAEQLAARGHDVDLSDWQGKGRVPSRDEVLSLLRPRLRPEERRLWRCLGFTDGLPGHERSSDWWLRIDDDWRRTIRPEIRTVVDGDRYLLGELRYERSYWWPSKVLDAALQADAPGESGLPAWSEGRRSSRRDAHLHRLGTRLVQSLGDLLLAIDAWCDRAAALGEAVARPDAWPLFRAAGPHRVTKVFDALDARVLTPDESASLEAMVRDLCQPAWEMARLLRELRVRAAPPEPDRLGDICAVADEFLGQASRLWAWPVRRDIPRRW